MSQKTVFVLLREMGQREPHTVHRMVSVAEAANLLAEYDVGALIVVDSQGVVGVISERDIARKVAANDLNATETLVEDVMSEKVISVTPFTNLKECEDLMRENGIRHLPVVDNGQLIAVISIRDLLVSTRLEQEQLVADLKGYIMGV